MGSSVVSLLSIKAIKTRKCSRREKTEIDRNYWVGFEVKGKTVEDIIWEKLFSKARRRHKALF
jgi:hypothetical protein